VLVDPGLLRAFAAQVDAASAGIRNTDIGHRATTAADGLPASTTQWAMRLVGEHIAQRADYLAANVTKMGAAVRGAGDRYEVDDAALAGSFDGVF
jgi:hypothetical protein